MYNTAPSRLTEAPYDYEILSGDTVTLSPPDGAIVIQNSFYSSTGTIVNVNSGNAEIVNDFVYTVNPAFRYEDTVVGVRNISNVTLDCSMSCLVEGTQITLADGSRKAIEDINYDDELLVWNFYKGEFDTARPQWIMRPFVTNVYYETTLSDGTIIKTVGASGHRLFNFDKNSFVYDTECVGAKVYKENGVVAEVVSCERKRNEARYYNIITTKHFNLFANGILTSCRLSNKYKIEDMRYVGDPLYNEAEERAYFNKLQQKKL